MIDAAANPPLTYAPIRIVDVSPYRSSLRARPKTGSRARRILNRAAALVLGVIAIAAVAAGVAAAPQGPALGDDFRLAPGNTMPLSLQGEGARAAPDGQDDAFRLGLGNAMPPSLAR